MTVRDGRIKRTETVSNNTHPEWNEELQFIVDDPDTQSVSVIVKDDDAFNDTVSAHCLASRVNVDRQILILSTLHFDLYSGLNAACQESCLHFFFL